MGKQEMIQVFTLEQLADEQLSLTIRASRKESVKDSSFFRWMKDRIKEGIYRKYSEVLEMHTQVGEDILYHI